MRAETVERIARELRPNEERLLLVISERNHNKLEDVWKSKFSDYSFIDLYLGIQRKITTFSKKVRRWRKVKYETYERIVDKKLQSYEHTLHVLGIEFENNALEAQTVCYNGRIRADNKAEPHIVAIHREQEKLKYAISLHEPISKIKDYHHENELEGNTSEGRGNVVWFTGKSDAVRFIQGEKDISDFFKDRLSLHLYAQMMIKLKGYQIPKQLEEYTKEVKRKTLEVIAESCEQGKLKSIFGLKEVVRSESLGFDTEKMILDYLKENNKINCS